MKNKWFFPCFFLGLSCAWGYLLIFPADASAAITQGVSFCLATIIPSLFPYFVLSNLLIHMGGAEWIGSKINKLTKKLFRLGGSSGSVLLLGTIGGYPLGAKTVGELYLGGKITKTEAEKLLTFACNAGPAFIIGVVGNALYQSPAVGVSLFCIHLLSALICGFLPYPFAERNQNNKSQPPDITQDFPSAFVNSVADSGENLLRVCWFIIFFRLVLSAVFHFLGKSSLLSCLIAGLTEFSTGCTMLSRMDLSWHLKFALTSFLISIGGLSVLFQTMAVLEKTDLRITPYIVGKWIQAIFSFLLAYPVSFFIRPATESGNFHVEIQPISPFPWSLFCFALIFLIFLQFSTRNSSSESL